MCVYIYIYIAEEAVDWREKERTREKERGREEEERRAEEAIDWRVEAAAEVDRRWHELGLSLLPSAWCVLVRRVEIDLR